jgi:hypothetical protein
VDPYIALKRPRKGRCEADDNNLSAAGIECHSDPTIGFMALAGDPWRRISDH